MRAPSEATASEPHLGVGATVNGQLLEYIAVEDEPDGWLVFHAMPATTKVLIEVGLRR